MNAIIINLGGLNVARLGCYGNGEIETPCLDRLAAEGFVFDQAFADSPCPAAARRAWWTARHQFFEAPGQAGAGISTDQAGSRDQCLLRLLRSNEIQTVLARDTAGLCPGEIPEQTGFGRIIELQPGPPDSAKRVFESAKQWLECEADEGPNLVFLDCWGVHPPTGPGLDQAQTVEYFDEQLGSFVDRLRALKGWGNALLVVTSDFGEPISPNEPGADVPALGEERVHVPLMLHWPEQAEPASRSPALVQAVDLMPTLSEAFGVAVPPSVHGRSLLPLVRFEQRKLREHVCTGVTDREWAIRTTEWHLIVPQSNPNDVPPGDPRLYVMPDDRWQRNDVARQFPEVVNELVKRLLGVRAECGFTSDHPY